MTSLTDGPVRHARWAWDESIELTIGDVRITPTTTDDAADLLAALDDDAVWIHVKGRPVSEAAWAETISTARSAGRWMWTVRERGVVVGTSSFLDLSLIDARVEIGHTTYAPSAWGTAVNPACKLLLMSWAFEECSMNRVQLKTDVRNLRSQAAIERLGATREGVLRMYQRRQDDSIRDTVMYSVLAHEWPMVKEGLLERLMP
ncbi:MAG: GNAT family N-acetyltransferase [Candidatus Nanopelagicales bacterium]